MNNEKRLLVEEELLRSLPPDLLALEGISKELIEKERRELMRSDYDIFLHVDYLKECSDNKKDPLSGV